MIPYYHQINSRQLTAFAPLVNEIAYDPNKNYLFDLSYLSGIQVTGDKSLEFLQGQLSCDIREVDLQHMRQGALCNLKGRILALLDVIQWETKGVQLVLPADMLIATQASLNKTAMISRVSIQTSTAYQSFGFYLQNPSDITPFEIELPNMPCSLIQEADYCCYCVGENIYILLVDPKQVDRLRSPFITTSQWRGSVAWHALQLQQKKIEIYPESRGNLLPHRLGLQLTNCLSFNKGCYKGQEVIARTHYLAKLKHELKLFTIQTKETLHSGLRFISNDGDQEVGELVDYCPLGNDKYLIAASVIFEHPSVVRLEGKTELNLNHAP